MPVDSTASITLSAYNKVPDFARGQVRDLRVRWALEEIGRPYRTELMDAFAERPAGYRQRQPFGQVPALRDGSIDIFESGAILIYIGEQDERLLPREPAAKWKAMSWTMSAFSSIEPPIMRLINLDLFNADKDWARLARVPALEFIEQRLTGLANALGSKDWLADRFTIADIAMITVLRNLERTEVLDGFELLTDYIARGTARPAFKAALAQQLADFDETISVKA